MSSGREFAVVKDTAQVWWPVVPAVGWGWTQSICLLKPSSTGPVSSHSFCAHFKLPLLLFKMIWGLIQREVGGISAEKTKARKSLVPPSFLDSV